MSSRSIALLICLAISGRVEAGSVVVNNDEWTTSIVGFTNAPDASIFVTNMASLFTAGQPGAFLGYSNNVGLTGSSLASALTSAGHTYTVSTASPFTLANISGYKGVFVGGIPAFGGAAVNPAVLNQYVEGGGNVYLMAGTSIDSTGEAAFWAPFLNHFGLALGAGNGITGNIPISSPHPLFAGAFALFQDAGQSIIDLLPADSKNQILVAQKPSPVARKRCGREFTRCGRFGHSN